MIRLRHFASFSLILLLGTMAHAQINPATQINWPGGCNSPAQVYNFYTNACITVNNAGLVGLPTTGGTMTGQIGFSGSGVAAGTLANLFGISSVKTTQQFMSGPLGANVNSDINVAAPPFNAVGDCTATGSTSGCTDNTTAIQSALTLAALTNQAVFSPSNGTSSQPTVYYVSGTLSPKGVSIHGPVGGGGTNYFNAQVSIRGAPGKDVFATGDPSSGGYAASQGGFIWKDFGIIVDDSVDVSSSNTHRKPGKTCPDVTATSSSAVITSAQCHFTAGDIGQNISLTDGTNTLTTTISSIGTGQPYSTTATMAANWTHTTHANSTLYVAIMYQSLAQRIGNCALAYDNTASTGTGGPSSAKFININITTTSQTDQNNSCGYFFQGLSGQPYNTIWEQNFIRTQWAFVAVESDGLAAGATNAALGDLNTFRNNFLEPTYPWVSYDGAITVWEGGQIAAAQDGPQILGYGEEQEDDATSWKIGPFEFADSTPPINMAWRVEGLNHKLEQTSIGYGSTYPAQWSALNSECNLCGLNAGNISITGALNKFAFSAGATPSQITDTGFSNLCSIGKSDNPFDGNEPGLPQSCSAVNSRQNNAFAQTADFVANGNESTPYHNQADLLLWPQDVYDNIGVNLQSYVFADSTSETGAYLSVPSGGWQFTYVNGSPITVGQVNTGFNLPATLVHVCYRLKLVSGGPAIYASLYANSTLVGSVNPNLTSSYASYCFDADLSSYGGDTAYFAVGASGTVAKMAWISVHPWQKNTNTLALTVGSGATPVTSESSANSQMVTCATGGSGTQYCDAAGNWVTPVAASTTGYATLSSGTVTVSNAAACTPSSSCTYKLTNCNTNSSAALGLPTIGTVVGGTSFVINSEGPLNTLITTDDSKICWQIN